MQQPANDKLRGSAFPADSAISKSAHNAAGRRIGRSLTEIVHTNFVGLCRPLSRPEPTRADIVIPARSCALQFTHEPQLTYVGGRDVAPPASASDSGAASVRSFRCLRDPM